MNYFVNRSLSTQTSNPLATIPTREVHFVIHPDMTSVARKYTHTCCRSVRLKGMHWTDVCRSRLQVGGQRRCDYSGIGSTCLLVT